MRVAIVDVLVAHNSAFDARMMKCIVPEIVKMQWLCTYGSWPWPALDNRKLDTVCKHFGISRAEIHSSLGDCQALADALLQYTGKTTRSRTYLAKLLSRRTHTHGYDRREPGRTTVKVTIEPPQFGQTQQAESASPILWVVFCVLVLGIFLFILWFSNL